MFVYCKSSTLGVFYFKSMLISLFLLYSRFLHPYFKFWVLKFYFKPLDFYWWSLTSSIIVTLFHVTTHWKEWRKPSLVILNLSFLCLQRANKNARRIDQSWDYNFEQGLWYWGTFKDYCIQNQWRKLLSSKCRGCCWSQCWFMRVWTTVPDYYKWLPLP